MRFMFTGTSPTVYYLESPRDTPSTSSLQQDTGSP